MSQRYFSYVEPNEDDVPVTVTLSEEDLKETYYKYWYERMCTKYGRIVVERDYNFEDCVEDFKVTNWAWESDEDGKQK